MKDFKIIEQTIQSVIKKINLINPMQATYFEKFIILNRKNQTIQYLGRKNLIDAILRQIGN